MATLLRVDPSGGCSAAPASTAILGGTLKSEAPPALATEDSTYYQVNPKTTTRTSATTIGQTSITVASASGFPASGPYYIRIDTEAMRVTAGQGATTWTVVRGQLGTTAANHANGATVTGLVNDWYGGFTGVPVGAMNLKVTYTGKNCSVTTSTNCLLPGTATVADGQDLQLDGRRGCGLCHRNVRRLASSSGTTGAATGRGTERHLLDLDAERTRESVHRHRGQPRAGASPRPHRTVERHHLNHILELGQPHEDRLRRPVTGPRKEDIPCAP